MYPIVYLFSFYTIDRAKKFIERVKLSLARYQNVRAKNKKSEKKKETLLFTNVKCWLIECEAQELNWKYPIEQYQRKVWHRRYFQTLCARF